MKGMFVGLMAMAWVAGVMADDGNALLVKCNTAVDHMESKPANGFQSGLCAGYVSGVANALTIYDIKSKRFCVPEGVTVGQLIRVTVKYLQDNPESLHMDQTALIVGAFTKAYPCPKEPF